MKTLRVPYRLPSAPTLLFCAPQIRVCYFKAETAQNSLPPTEVSEASEATDTRSILPSATEGLLCVNAGSPSLLSNLLVAVRDGRSLLVEDVGTSIDPVLDPVLCHKTFMKVHASRSLLSRQ